MIRYMVVVGMLYYLWVECGQYGEDYVGLDFGQDGLFVVGCLFLVYYVLVTIY